MEKINHILIDEYSEALEFAKAASRRHIIIENVRRLAFILNESEYSDKVQKINKKKQNLKIVKCGE